MTTTCGTCGKLISVPQWRITRSKSGLVFCSKGCQLSNPTVRASMPQHQSARVALVCPICSEHFERKHAEVRATNYCSYRCAGKAATHLRPIPKGKRVSPSTEFRPGVVPTNKLPVGSVRIRKTKGGELRAFVKVAEPNRWRARALVVWEAANGPLPRGSVVHHDNRDPLDDRLENLIGLTRAEHLAEHRSEHHSIAS